MQQSFNNQQQENHNQNTLQKELGNTKNEFVATPMLAILGLHETTLRKVVDTINQTLLTRKDSKKIEISLINGPKAFVCSGIMK